MKAMKIINVLLIVCLSLSYYNLFSQTQDSAYGKPLIALTITHPWGYWSGLPSLVIYENGFVIRRVLQENQEKFYEATLSKLELEQTIKSFSIPSKLYELDDYIEAIDATDQASNILYLDITAKKIINVYGSLDIKRIRKRAPKVFLKVFDRLESYKISNSSIWQPKKYKIILSVKDYGNSNGTKWPDDFEDLNSPNTTNFRDFIYTIVIDKNKIDTFLDYYNSLGKNKLVEINGRQMWLGYEPLFPGLEIK
jgi:hypothetical protein